MTWSKLSIYKYLSVVVLLLFANCSSTKSTVPKMAQEPTTLESEQSVNQVPQSHTAEDFSPFIECIEEPTKMFRYAVGEWKVKSIRVMPNAQQRIYSSQHMLTDEELAAIRKAHFTIREGEVQNIGLNAGGRLCAGEKFTVGSGHFPLFPDSFAEIGISPKVKYVYYIVIHEIGYFYFLIDFDELLATPAVLIDTSIGKIKLPEAHYVIFQKVAAQPFLALN